MLSLPRCLPYTVPIGSDWIKPRGFLIICCRAHSITKWENSQ